jgi:hypothetical protein
LRVRIGLSQAPRELDLDVEDTVVEEIEAAMADGSAVVWITDRKGKRYGLATGKIAFVEMEPEEIHGGVGFGG